jgi:hypothetical protein
MQPRASSRISSVTYQMPVGITGEEGSTMPKKTATAAKKSAAKKSSAKPASNGAGEAKRAAREAQSAEQLSAVVSRVVNGDEKLSVVAKDLKITPGKAAFLIMQHRVAEGEVPAITGKNDEALLKAINAARLKADEFSSWGWLSARSGKSEGFIKAGLAKAGLFTPRAENIATKRAGSKPKAAAKTTATSAKKRAGKKRVSGNA